MYQQMLSKFDVLTLLVEQSVPSVSSSLCVLYELCFDLLRKEKEEKNFVYKRPVNVHELKQKIMDLKTIGKIRKCYKEFGLLRKKV